MVNKTIQKWWSHHPFFLCRIVYSRRNMHFLAQKMLPLMRISQIRNLSTLEWRIRVSVSTYRLEKMLYLKKSKVTWQSSTNWTHTICVYYQDFDENFWSWKMDSLASAFVIHLWKLFLSQLHMRIIQLYKAEKSVKDNQFLKKNFFSFQKTWNFPTWIHYSYF